MSKSTFFVSGSISGLSCWILVGFCVVDTLQVNAYDTFATNDHISACLYVKLSILKIMGGCQNSLKSFKPDLDWNKLGLNLV